MAEPTIDEMLLLLRQLKDLAWWLTKAKKAYTPFMKRGRKWARRQMDAGIDYKGLYAHAEWFDPRNDAQNELHGFIRDVEEWIEDYVSQLEAKSRRINIMSDKNEKNGTHPLKAVAEYHAESAREIRKAGAVKITAISNIGTVEAGEAEAVVQNVNEDFLILNNLPSGETTYEAMEILKAHREKGGKVVAVMPEGRPDEVMEKLKGIYTDGERTSMLNDSRKTNAEQPEKPKTNRGPIVRAKKGH